MGLTVTAAGIAKRISSSGDCAARPGSFRVASRFCKLLNGVDAIAGVAVCVAVLVTVGVLVGVLVDCGLISRVGVAAATLRLKSGTYEPPFATKTSNSSIAVTIVARTRAVVGAYLNRAEIFFSPRRILCLNERILGERLGARSRSRFDAIVSIAAA